MEIKHEDNRKKGRFYIELDGTEEAEIVYSYAGVEKIIIEHTEVSEKLKGQGVGINLLEETVSFMRKNNLKAIPLCPFANAILKKNRKKYEDVKA